MELFFIVFLRVFLHGFQQQNVIQRLYLCAAITSLFMALMEVALVLRVVHHGWSSLPYIAVGGVCGILSAMRLHERLLTWLRLPRK